MFEGLTDSQITLGRYRHQVPNYNEGKKQDYFSANLFTVLFGTKDRTKKFRFRFNSKKRVHLRTKVIQLQ